MDYSKNHNELNRNDNSQSEKSNNEIQDILELLESFKKEVCNFLNSVSHRDIKPQEIFTRWYLNSFSEGEKDYFMPKVFKAHENDLAYYKEYLSSTTTPEEICKQINTIFQKYCDQEYCIKEKTASFTLSNSQKNRLHQIYKGSKDDFQNKANLLLSAYMFMGTLNNHLSVPPEIFKNLQITELFGSPLNTSYSYCSLFSLEKEFFSSNGSFFKYEIQPGLHVANPPFDETIMEAMAYRLEAQLDKTAGINIICIIPVWDEESQRKYGLKVYKKRFEAYEKLKTSKYFKQGLFLDKDRYPFWDYYKSDFAPASATHFIVLSNTENLMFSPEKICEDWRNLPVAAAKKQSSWRRN